MSRCPVASRAIESPVPLPAGGVFRRYLLAAMGIVFVGIGWIGAFLPGIPTVGPLLIASYCFTRSCPWLEQRLIRNRFFAPFLQYLDGARPLPTKARIGAIATMWTSILLSSTILLWANRSTSTIWIVCLILASGTIGTIAIWRFRRTVSKEAGLTVIDNR